MLRFLVHGTAGICIGESKNSKKKKLKESLRQKEREKAEQRKRTINLNSINQSKSSFRLTVKSSQFFLPSLYNTGCNTMVEQAVTLWS